MDEYLMAFFFGIFTYFLGKILSKINLNKQSLILIENKTFSKSSELLIREQLKRNYEFFEEKGMKLIRDSTILIYGLEGIGSHVCLTLIRSGVKKLIIIDNNTLTKEFFPYHPLSILSDLGKRNIDIIDFYGKRINPNVIIEKYVHFLSISFQNSESQEFISFFIEVISYCYHRSTEKSI